MTQSTFATLGGARPAGGPSESTYQPGVCNIGPAEIATRRRFGHLGLAVTVVMLAILLIVNAPPLARLLVGLPAAAAAVGYLQARFHFCAGFAQRGVFNLGDTVGQITQIDDSDAHARDIARGRQIYLGSLAIGIAVGIVAALLPV